MTKTGLVLAAHGSWNDSAVNASIVEWAKQLLAIGVADEVAAAFHQGTPHFSNVLDSMTADAITVVPLMTSSGYYSDTVLPRELARNRRVGEIQLRQTAPVESHARVLEIVVHRISEVLGEFRLDGIQTTVALIGHGTKRHFNSKDATEALAAGLRSRRMVAEVLTGYLDDEPLLESIGGLGAGELLLVVPNLIGGGLHATKDIPTRLGLGAYSPRPPFIGTIKGRRCICDRAVGLLPGMFEIIADLARGAGDFKVEQGRPTVFLAPPSSALGASRGQKPAARVVRLGTRATKMAIWQANHVAGRLRAYEVQVEIVELTTSGDRALGVPLERLSSNSPFTDDIDLALQNGDIDMAVHCLKDLPLELYRRFDGDAEIITSAVLPRADAREALVSHDSRVLSNLPSGATVGTSCLRRAAQVLALRPDIRPLPMRGPVDDRVRQVRTGRFDAAVLAVAGLKRLGLTHEIAEIFPADVFVPAPGQGALVIQVKRGDAELIALTLAWNDEPTALATKAELAFLQLMEGIPDRVGAAFAQFTDQIEMLARVITRDGREVREISVVGTDPLKIALAAAQKLGFANALRIAS